MSRQATFEFKHAIDAYSRKDETLANSVMTTDSVLDATHQDLLQAIFTAHRLGNCDIEVALQVALVGRFMERIGDHAVNLSRSIHYTVTGEPGPDLEGAARREILGN
jgi:phosphate transport system protein